MSSEHNANYGTVEGLFDSQQVYRVPIYQRPYEWKPEEVEAFLADIKMSAECPSGDARKNHFFGSFIFTGPESGADGIVYYSIIDGQQRLTALSLFFHCLTVELSALGSKAKGALAKKILERADELAATTISFVKDMGGEEKSFHRLVLPKCDMDFFYALLDGDHSPVPSRDSHERIIATKKRMSKFLQEEISTKNSDKDKFRTITLYSDTVLNWPRVVIQNKSDVESYRIFQVINDRGRNLLAGALLRARTFEAISTIDQKTTREDLEKKAVVLWDAILADSPDAIEEFLRYRYISHTGKSITQKQNLKETIKHFFPVLSQTAIAASDGKALVSKIRDLKSDLSLLQKISNGDWPYAKSTATRWDRQRLSNLINELNHRHCIPLVLSARKLKEKKFIEIVAALERFFVRYKVIGKRPAQEFTHIYNKHVLKIRKDPDHYNPKEFIETLRKLAESKVPDNHAAYVVQNMKFKGAVGHATKRGDLRFLLYLLEEYWQWHGTKATGAPSKASKARLINYSELSIEHIYPQSADKACKISKLEPIKHNIGNLTILDKTDNSASGNQPYSDKRKVFLISSLDMNRDVAKNKHWTTKKTINDRSKQLAEMAAKIFMP